MRARLALIVAFSLVGPAQAQQTGSPDSERPFVLELPSFPPVAADADAPVTIEEKAGRIDLAPPELPPVELAFPNVEPVRTEPPVANAPVREAAPAGEAAPAAVAARPAIAPDFSAPALPEPLDPNGIIAMMPDRPPVRTDEAPAPLPLATPSPVPAAPHRDITAAPVATPVAPTAVAGADLQKDRLETALIEIGVLQPQSAATLQAIRDFYDKRAHAPAWTAGGALTPKAQALLAAARGADSHGLDPARFRKLAEAALADTASAEKREVAISALTALYARDARGGRINPQQISRLITANPTFADPISVLETVSSAQNAASALEAYNPSHPGYLALKAKLAEARAADTTASTPPKLTFGKLLTTGMSDPRVPLLRSALGLPPQDSLVFDAALAEAVRGLQRERGLKVNGRLDRATVAALGGVDPDLADSRNPTADIIANMERWRWLPTDLGKDHVFVNIPNYSLALMRGDVAEMKTRVIVGKPQTPTPVFSHRMQFLVINPYWNVPPSIALKELLPLLQKNPSALQARGLEVVSRGRVVDPATVNWGAVGRTVAIRQPPGERNALGHIKFMFPNEHAVYLHDTPGRGLFVNDRRAYSHGCVRVQDPFRLAEAVMGEGWSAGRLRSMVGGPERQVKLPGELPVHLAYFTSFVDDAGALQTREDIYGHNRKLKTLLGL